MKKHEKERQLINKLLDVLVEMSNHCNSMESNIPNKSKCVNCGFARDFGIIDSGCLLVDILENEYFLHTIKSTCLYHDIECENKLNQAMEIFEEEEYQDEFMKDYETM